MDSIRPRAADAPELDTGAPVTGAHMAAPEAYDEKIDIKEGSESIKSGHEAESDPFLPFPEDPDMPAETHSQILTVRAVVVGCILGGLVNASNVYLGMRFFLSPTRYAMLTIARLEDRLDCIHTLSPRLISPH
jgi:hypothetical protein